MRRGAAWPPAERPSSCLWCSRQSRALAGGLTAEPSWLPSAACAAHSNTLWRPSGVVLSRMSGRPPCLGRPVRVFRQRRPVQRPPVQRLASGACPASACPGLRVRCRASGVRCPVSMSVSVSGVQCPVSTSGVRLSGAGVRHSCVSRLCPLCPHREFMEGEGAVAATRLGTGRVGVSPHHVCDRLVGCPTGLESGTQPCQG